MSLSELGGAPPVDPELEPGADEERDWEAEARPNGWRPREEYRGPPEKWCDARTFVLRGEEALPVAREQNRRLAEKLTRAEKQIESLQGKLEEQSADIKALVEMAKTSRHAGYQQALKDLETRRKDAIRSGDEHAVDQIEAAIEQVKQDHAKTEPKAPEPKTVTTTPPARPARDPAYDEFEAANSSWWNKDNVLTPAMMAAHNEVMGEHPGMSVADQLAEAKKRVVALYPRKFGVAPNPAPAPESEEEEEEPAPPPRRTPAVVPPRGHVPQREPQARSVWERIPADERAAAKAEFQRMSKHDEGLTAEEYVETYTNPHLDILAVQKKFRKK